MLSSPREHLLLPWAVQEREDPVLEFDRAEGVYFFDSQGRRYIEEGAATAEAALPQLAQAFPWLRP